MQLPEKIDRQVNPITKDELKAELKLMANGKSSDTRGVVAEILQNSTDAVLGMIADISNDVLKTEAEVPESWKDTSLKVLFEKCYSAGRKQLPTDFNIVDSIQTV